jgi:two-component system nitrogen regulation response regulator GlnG
VADIPVELLESELFGHEKGAFKGAGDQRIGRFEQADKGTLFLDEVGDMPLETQTRIIRVLSSGEFYRIGGNSPIQVDVRIIAATNQNLEEKVRNGSFREDLYHRLNVIKINLPPLRDRKEDIILLTSYFLKKFSEEAKTKVKVLGKEVEELFENLIWPGNVLQLQNVCQSLTLLSSGQEVTISDIPKDLSLQRKGPEMSWSDLLESWASKRLLKGEDHILNNATPIFESTMIKAALKVTKGKKSEAAKLLGWGRNTLARKITELDL